MLNINTLADLTQGDMGIVQELSVSGSIRRRLQDLGLTPGTKVECLMVSPLGDPIAYLIRGVVVALRLSDSRRVMIQN